MSFQKKGLYFKIFLKFWLSKPIIYIFILILRPYWLLITQNDVWEHLLKIRTFCTESKSGIGSSSQMFIFFKWPCSHEKNKYFVYCYWANFSALNQKYLKFNSIYIKNHLEILHFCLLPPPGPLWTGGKVWNLKSRTEDMRAAAQCAEMVIFGKVFIFARFHWS